MSIVPDVVPAVIAVLRGFLWFTAVTGGALICFLIGRMIEGWRVRQ